MVEGDNLDVLALLAEERPGSLDLVYLDPPYNRRHERAYPDDFAAARGSGGGPADPRGSHARWLAFLRPRVELARVLLAERGVLAASIDDVEVARLRILLDEVFGEENFVAQIVVSLNPKGRQLAPFFATSHEYLLIVARDARRTALVPATREAVDPADFPREDAQGRLRFLPLRNTNKKFHPGTSPTLHYPLHAHPEDGRVRAEPFEGSVEVWPRFGDATPAVWRWSARRVAAEPDAVVARRVKGADGERLDVFQVDRLTAARTKKLRTVWTADEIGSTDDAVQQLKELVGPVFPTPKPVGLLRRLLACLPPDAHVLDPFAGSGTTGQAVVEANAEDGGTRRVVLVQTPEPSAPGSEAARRGLETIADVTRARLAAAIGRARRSTKREVPGLLAFAAGAAADEARAPCDDRARLLALLADDP
ncbi:MAG: site-specific DNA-methyltransferase [Planctomycetes bacterium]|nr:site-specific DNA-methyltransferase [Planctomycetota bacterium]